MEIRQLNTDTVLLQIGTRLVTTLYNYNVQNYDKNKQFDKDDNCCNFGVSYK